MVELNGFMKEHFIQTRKEIDTEKHERDQMLNFAIVVLGAIGFAIIQKGVSQTLLQEPQALLIETPALIIISSLFWIRYKKLHQIADRWFVLYRMACQHLGKDKAEEMLEAVVVKGLIKWRYISKDFILNLALSLPIYGLLLIQCFNAYTLHQYWRIVLPIVIIISHFAISSFILGRKMRDPLPSIKQ